MGKVVTAIAGAVLTVVGFMTANPALIIQGMAMTISSVASMLTPPKNNNAGSQRLNKTLNPEDFRKVVFGSTAGGCDLRYWEVNANGDRYMEIIAVATHKITRFRDFYIENLLALSESGVKNATYSNMGSVAKVTEGVSGAGGILSYQGLWDSRMSFTGCAYYAIDWARDTKNQPNGIPGRYTMVVDGAPVYDPRRDVSLGGTHSITDQTTWEYDPADSTGQPIGRNNALQMLWYLIGWRINGVLVAGRGVDPADLNLDDFILAANDCEAYGWYSDMVLSTGDTHQVNEGIICAASRGKLLDTGGRFSYHVSVNDTSNVAQNFTDADIVGNVTWVPRQPMDQQYNECAGTFTDPTPTSLYQPRTYGTASDATYIAEDGFKRRMALNLQAVQDQTQAQKLARLEINTRRLQGQLTATFSYKALRTKNWNIVTLTFSRYGWVNKLFRITQQSINPMGGIDMVLAEEDPAFYAGGTVEATFPGTGAGNPLTARYGVDGYGAVEISRVSADGRMTQDGARAFWTRPSSMVSRTDVMYRPIAPTSAPWTLGGTLPYAATSDQDSTTDYIDIYPLAIDTAFEVRARHVSIYGVPGNWSSTIVTTGATTSMDASLVKLAGLSLQQALDDNAAGIVAMKDFQDKLAELNISSSVRVQQLRDYLETLGYNNGVPLGTIIAQNQTQQVDGDNLLAQIISLIGAVSTDGGSFIINTLTAKTSPTQTLAQAFAQQSSYTDSLRSDWSSQVTTQASTNSTYASNFALLGAQGVGVNVGSWVLNTSTVKTTFDGQTLGTTLSGLQSASGTNAANITAEANTRAAGDTANATNVTNLTTTVNGHTSSITSLQTSVNGINARATLTLDVNGHISGYQIASTSTTSSFYILTNNFAIVDSGGVGGTFTPFSYSGGVFRMTNVVVDTLAAGIVTTDHLVGAAVTTVTFSDQAWGGGGLSTGETTIFTVGHTTTVGGTTHLLSMYALFTTGGGASSATVRCRIYRDGGLIGETYGNTFGSGWPCSLPATIADSPGAGGHTYTITAAILSGSGTPVVPNHTLMTITELKR